MKNVERTNAFFERFGGLAVIVARFVPIVRTFAPVAAGVGKMDYRKYTIYNLIGALIWGSGLTYGGYLLGYVPVLGDFIREYIDVILILAVLATVVPTSIHYILNMRKSRREAERVSREEAEALALAPKDFDQKLGD